MTTVDVSQYQAIETRLLAPTCRAGSRIKAMCSAGQTTIPCDSAKETRENHATACRVLLVKLGWEGDYIGGFTKTGSYIFVTKSQMRSANAYGQ